MFCPFELSPKFLIYSSDIPALLYYSHIPAMVIALIIGLILFLKERKSLIGKTFFGIMVLFSIWAFFALILWATNRGDMVMLLWSYTILVESLIFAAALYFVYVFINKQDASLKTKLVIGGLLFPIIALLSTKFNLEGVDLTYCDAMESFIALYYIYVVEVIFSLWIILFSIKKYKVSQDLKTKKEILYITTGIAFFLLTFSWGNIIGSFGADLESWDIAQYGLFGMPVFIAFLAYSIVKFKTFNIKLIGVNVLIVALWFLVASLFLITDITTLRVVAGITLVFITILGYFLVKSVRREVRQREELLIMTKMFQAANKQLDELNNFKSQFLSFASHQIKAPMAIIKGFAELLYSGSFGQMPDSAKDAILYVNL